MNKAIRRFTAKGRTYNIGDEVPKEVASRFGDYVGTDKDVTEARAAAGIPEPEAPAPEDQDKGKTKAKRGEK